jgi:transposase-like protein
VWPRTGETTTRRPRSNHTSAFKAKVALAAIEGKKTLVELAQQFDVQTNHYACLPFGFSYSIS